MEQKHTDKKLLGKGIKFMALSLPLFFLCPYFITLSFLNKENYFFYIFLIIGIIFGAGVFYLFFKGLKTIMKSIF